MPFTEAETSDSSTLLESVIKVSNIRKRVLEMRGVLEVSDSVQGPYLTSPTIFNFIRKSEFSLLKGATVVIFACFRKIQLLFCL